MYPYLTMPDGTEIVFSEIRNVDGEQKVRVYWERWSDKHNDFDSMDAFLPEGIIQNIVGFSTEEVIENQKLIDYVKEDLWIAAKEGGIK